jgi:hypothetical protein
VEPRLRLPKLLFLDGRVRGLAGMVGDFAARQVGLGLDHFLFTLADCFLPCLQLFADPIKGVADLHLHGGEHVGSVAAEVAQRGMPVLQHRDGGDVCLWVHASLPLLEVFLDALGLAEQEGDVQVSGLDEALEHMDGFVERLAELVVLLVAPRVPQSDELTVNSREVGRQIAIEALQAMREATQFGGVNDRLRHGFRSPEGFGCILAQ